LVPFTTLLFQGPFSALSRGIVHGLFCVWASDFPENLNVCVMADLFLKAKLAQGINVIFLKLDKRT